MRVLVLWADDRSANLGVRALARGAESLARQALGPDIEIEFQDLAKNADGFSPSMGLIKRDLIKPRGPIREWLSRFDLVLDTGAGDSFADIYGPRRITRMLYVQLAARRLRIPLVLTPQTVGPFRTRRFRLGARMVLKRAAFVAARDSASAAYAASLRRPVDVVATDVVFALPQPAPGPARDVLLNVSGLLWNSSAHADPEHYRTQIRALITGLRDRGREVALLAHVIDNPTADNDVPVVRELAEELGLEAVVPASLDEVRSAVSSARLVIGSRMHACLNAISTGTPAIAWAYSRKFAPLLGDLGWRHTLDLRSESAPAERTLALLDGTPEDELRRQVHDTLAITTSRLRQAIDGLARLRPALAPALRGEDAPSAAS
ncbi:polysaccharide pyruvyl transferase family protein [Naasia sp. SYSU D00948]|uniref:polysaccharide pyruvyl transferase family protein n=1 Tax=Naasia sp. SYSU D00948 TaxID=2817379 RepID=UPI001B30C80D|nr:polysaccharide pyruvyl transferase family protein [Naasia sp. SYSU D00948]